MWIRCSLCGKLVREEEEGYRIKLNGPSGDTTYCVCMDCFWKIHEILLDRANAVDRILSSEKVKEDEQSVETDGKGHS